METNSTTPEVKEVKAPVTPEAEQEKKPKKRILLVLLLLISLGGNGVLFWFYLQERNRANVVITEKETVIVERENIKADLVQLQTDYGTLQTSDKKIQGELDEKKEQIAKLIVEAEKHKNDAYFISKLKKETETLRKIMQGYVRTIDSLGIMNKTLLTENVHVRTQFLSEKEKAAQLSQDKENLQDVINVASLLKANGTKAMGINLRSGGKKESETKRARKTDKIKVTLTVAQNDIAKKGNRDVYLRIMTPDGKELARALDDANSFAFNGVRGFFCARQTIKYDNKEVPVALYAENKAGYIPGKYIIEVYCDQAMMGQTTLTLE
jgi:flagellar basal body-associated protein FliL